MRLQTWQWLIIGLLVAQLLLLVAFFIVYRPKAVAATATTATSSTSSTTSVNLSAVDQAARTIGQVVVVDSTGALLPSSLVVNDDGSLAGVSSVKTATNDSLIDSSGVYPASYTTAELNALTTPARPVLVFNSTTGTLQFHPGTSGGRWYTLAGGVLEAGSTGVFQDATHGAYKDQIIKWQQVLMQTGQTYYAPLYRIPFAREFLRLDTPKSANLTTSLAFKGVEYNNTSGTVSFCEVKREDYKAPEVTGAFETRLYWNTSGWFRVHLQQGFSAQTAGQYTRLSIGLVDTLYPDDGNYVMYVHTHLTRINSDERTYGHANGTKRVYLTAGTVYRVYVRFELPSSIGALGDTDVHSFALFERDD